jgi:hypothetical protein
VPASRVEVEVADPDEEDHKGMGEARYLVRRKDIPDSAAITTADVIARTMPGTRVRPSFCPQITTRNGVVTLVVIDHQVFHDTCVLNLVEPEDIETLALLPSHAASIRYGASGGGVIVITTRHGSEEAE